MKKIFIIFGIAIAAAIAFLIYNQMENNHNDGTIQASGNIEITEVNAGFKIQGRIVELFVTEGQKVNKGDLIAKIDDTELKNIVEQNKASLNEAIARLDELKAGSRMQEIEQAKLNVNSAESLLKEAGARLGLLKSGARPQEIEQAKLNVELQESALKEANIRLEELKAGARPQEIEQVNLNLESAKVERDKSKKDFDRAETLFKNGAISASLFDAAKSIYDARVAQYKNANEKLSLINAGARKEEIQSAENRIEQAKTALANAKEKLNLIKEGNRQEEIQAANERVEQAKSAVDAAKEKYSLIKEGNRKETIRVAALHIEQIKTVLNTSLEKLNDTLLYAPTSGIVLVKSVEIGEIAGSGTTVCIIGDIENAWIKIYVKETKLGLVKLGQKAEIATDSYPGKIYVGQVSYISSEAEFTPKNIQTKEERIKLVFGVKVSVLNKNQELKPGMPADVRILLK